MPQRLELLPQRHDRGHDVQAREPAPEGVDLRLDDGLGLGRRRGPRPTVVGDDPFQVVDIVEVEAIESVHCGIDRTGNGEVDHEHRTAPPLAEGFLQGGRSEQEVFAARGAGTRPPGQPHALHQRVRAMAFRHRTSDAQPRPAGIAVELAVIPGPERSEGTRDP